MFCWNKKGFLSVSILLACMAGNASNGISLIERNPFYSAVDLLKSQQPLELPEPDPELDKLLAFVGTYEFAGERKFSLQLLAQDNKKFWREMGENVLGYTLENYRADSRTLLVKKDDVFFSLSLLDEGKNGSKERSSPRINNPPLRSQRPPIRIPKKVKLPNVLPRKA